jgi:hypothetical protein
MKSAIKPQIKRDKSKRMPIPLPNHQLQLKSFLSLNFLFNKRNKLPRRHTPLAQMDNQLILLPVPFRSFLVIPKVEQERLSTARKRVSRKKKKENPKIKCSSTFHQDKRVVDIMFGSIKGRECC